MANALTIISPDGSWVEFPVLLQFPDKGISDMGSPVQCTYCRSVYDLQKVDDFIARHADCDVFRTPCCNRQADTREYLSLPSFTRLH